MDGVFWGGGGNRVAHLLIHPIFRLYISFPQISGFRPYIIYVFMLRILFNSKEKKPERMNDAGKGGEGEEGGWRSTKDAKVSKTSSSILSFAEQPR